MLETLAISTAPPDLCARAHDLWDTLADYDAARIDDALDCLMRGLCDLVGAQNAVWAGMVRFADTGGDPTGGWRPLAMRFLVPTEKLLAAIRAQTRRMDRRFTNDAVAAVAARAGNFRAHRLCDLVPSEWFASDCYRNYYEDCDRGDALYAAFPVNTDTESWFGVFRACGRPPFTAPERDAIAYALRAVKWFHRHLLLSHGLLVAAAPLTEVERRVLQGLLAGRSEKTIASEFGQSHHTIHGHVTSIYRKFGVNNRAALMALWLGTGSSGEFAATYATGA